MADILLLNGPNINMLGHREPDIYGVLTLDDIVLRLSNTSKKNNLTFEHYHSNSEGELINKVQTSTAVKYIIINPAGYTHTSVALRDALLAINVPFTEVHLSNIYKREEFRHYSYFSDVAQGVISGFGDMGYDMALTSAIAYIKNTN